MKLFNRYPALLCAALVAVLLGQVTLFHAAIGGAL